MHYARHKAEHNEKEYVATGSLDRALGHRVMLFPSTMAAIYGWDPNPFGAMDALRLG